MESREIIFDEKTQMFIRPWESDRYIYGQVRKDYKKFKVTSEDVILDIGANIGGFPVFINNKKTNPAMIISVEPVKSTYGMLLKNTERFDNVSTIQAAVVHNPTEDVNHIGEEEIYISSACGMNSLYKIRGKKTEKIKTIEYRMLLENYRPTIIKMDCEGSEFDLLQWPIPDTVKQVIVEFTYNRVKDAEDKARKVYQFLTEQGFTFDGIANVEELLPSTNPSKSFHQNNARTYYLYR